MADKFQTTRECTWAYDEDGVWIVSCGHTFSIYDGTPKENLMAFCCYCGKPLRQLLKEDAKYVSPL